VVNNGEEWLKHLLHNGLPWLHNGIFTGIPAIKSGRKIPETIEVAGKIIQLLGD